MPKCTHCWGDGRIICPVCKGTNQDPRNPSKPCSYCGGEKKVKCPTCKGSGQE